jgi:murein tripeptide amidase MpaA
MRIEGGGDGGAIEILDDAEGGDAGRGAGEIRLALRGDGAADIRQWFCFDVHDAAGETLSFSIENAAQATYADAFDGYRVCATDEARDEIGSERWYRVPSAWDGATLRFSHTPSVDHVRYAYFATYPWARHEALMARVDDAPGAEVVTIGETTQGRPMHLAILAELPDAGAEASFDAEHTLDEGARGEPDEAPRDPDDTTEEVPRSLAGERLRVWLIARQHPGETMAEWLAEGFLSRLLDADDPATRALRARATFYVVANMNPDGGVLGNLRTNASGANLNRAWLEPSLDESPEVHAVRAVMEDVGVDLFVDVHGDERNPWCFLAGCEGNPSWSPRLQFLENLFEQTLCAANGDFQDEYGYPRDEPGGGDLRTAANWVGERFDCLAWTLEMPFKDAANEPDPWVGWSPSRSKELGASLLDAIGACLDHLRVPLPHDEDTI